MTARPSRRRRPTRNAHPRDVRRGGGAWEHWALAMTARLQPRTTLSTLSLPGGGASAPTEHSAHLEPVLLNLKEESTRQVVSTPAGTDT